MAMSNKSFQPTKPLVTALAGARPAPNAFAAEADVIRISKRRGGMLVAANGIPFTRNAWALATFSLLCLVVLPETSRADVFIIDTGPIYRVVEGKRISIVLYTVPAKYEVTAGQLIDLFAVSHDSVFWSRHANASPCEAAAVNLFLRKPADFFLDFCTESGELIETVKFDDIASGSYTVCVGRPYLKKSGGYLFRYRYEGSVVGEYKIRL